MKTVFIVTNPEYGWDCVLYASCSSKKAIAYCANRDNVAPEEWDASDSMYIIHEKILN